VTLTFDSVIPKSLRFLCYPGWMCGQSLKKVGLGVLKLFLAHLDPVTLTFHPVTPKSTEHLRYQGRMCGPNLRKVCHEVLELLIGNKKVSDVQTDRQTCAKQYALSLQKRGHKK